MFVFLAISTVVADVLEKSCHKGQACFILAKQHERMILRVSASLIQADTATLAGGSYDVSSSPTKADTRGIWPRFLSQDCSYVRLNIEES